MKLGLFIAFLLITALLKGQNILDWNENYELQLSDFQSPASEIGSGTMYSLNSACNLSYSFSMTNAEFMFTKNFNTKVICSFDRLAATLVAPDSAIADNLLHFARYDFDLSELYSRKLRKKLFEAKNTFSDISFVQPLFDDIQRELSEKHTMAAKLTDLGSDREKLAQLHQEVISEIALFPDFCKLCKPPKKKKNG